MSTVVDQRVVEMRFDNQNFERNVSNTMSALDKLKQSLRFTGVTKGFEDVSTAARGVNLSGLGSAIDTVGLKFSAMYSIADQTLRNITNSAINTGKRMVSALTIDPIKTGFSEYETQIGAVQTILANTESKGTTLGDVNKALDELNTYADKTIYNFTEMTRNIGTFTAAGVDLDKSVTSIKGIANLAAVSGSTSQQASTAMYQLSQALAAGKVQLMDWNSVVNAGMGGQVFQDALKRTAKNLGTNVDAMIEKYGSFRESLTKGEWLTAEVLTETLTQLSGAYSEADLLSKGYTKEQAAEILKLADTAVQAATKVKTFSQLWDTLKESAQSRWTQTWETMVGDFEEAKEFLTNISDTLGGLIGESADRRNELLSGGLDSNWKKLINSINEAGIETSAFEESIRKVVNDDDKLDGLIEEYGTLGNVFKEGALSSDILTKALAGLEGSPETMNELSKSCKGFIDNITVLGGRENIIQALWNSFNGLMSVITPIKDAFRDIFPPMTADQLYNFTEKLKDFTSKLVLSGEQSKKLKSTFKGIFAGVDIVWSAVKAVGGGILELISHITGIGSSILSTTGSIGEWISGIRDSIKETNVFGNAVDKIVGFLAGAIDKLRAFGKSVKESFAAKGYEGFAGFIKLIWEFLSKIGSSITSTFSMISDSLIKVFDGSFIDNLLSTGLFTGILLGIKKFVDTLKDILDSGGGFLENISETLDEVRGCFEAYQANLNAATLGKIATAIALLAGSLFLISIIQPDKIEMALGTITVLFVELLAAMAAFTKISAAGFKGAARASIIMTSMGTAILILAAAMKVLSTVEPDGIMTGLLAIGVLMAEMSIFLRTFKFDKKIKSAAVGIVIMASSMLIMAKAVEAFAAMNMEQIHRGVVAIGILLGELALFSRITGKSNHILATGASMVLLGASLKIFASAIKDFSTMQWDEIGRGLGAMAGALLAITLAIRAMPNNILGIAVGFTVISAALLVMAHSVKSFATMTWDEIGRGLAVMGGSLVILAGALALMRGSIAGSAALIIAAGALAIIAPVMRTLGEMNLKQIGIGLAALAGAFTVIGLAGYLLAPIVPALLGLAGAMALFSLSIIGLGAGLTLVATGFTALAIAIGAGAATIVSSLSIILLGIADLIPQLAQKLGEGIVEFAKVIGEFAPTLAEAALKLILEVLRSCETYAPQIVESLAGFLIGVLDALSGKLPELIKSAVNVISAFFQGVIDALAGIDTSSLLKGIAGIALMSGLMLALSAVAGLIPGAMLGVLGMGVVIAELSAVLAAVGLLAQIPGLAWLINEGGNFLQTIGTAIGKFIGGIAGGVAEGATSSLPKIGTDLSTFMTNIKPFIDGIKLVDASVATGIQSLANAILVLTAANVLDGLTKWITGGSSLTEFGSELAAFGPHFNAYYQSVKGIDGAVVTASTNAALALAEMASALPNSGGLASWFTGEHSLSEFADELVKFGPKIKQYADSVSGIDSSAVISSANAGKALSEMAANLPNSGGVAGWFAGENDISDFGDALVKFGKSMAAFSNEVAGVNAAAISATITQFRNLVNMAKGMSGVDFGVFGQFGQELEKLGKVNIDKFIAAFSDAQTNATVVINNLISSILGDIKRRNVDFTSMGKALATNFENGLISSTTSVTGKFSTVLSAIIVGIRNRYSDFHRAGAYLVSGFANGISANTYKAAAKARAMAAAAERAAREELDEHSPSKVGYEIGDFFGIAFVNGIADWVSKAYNTSAEMAASAKSGLGDAISKIANAFESDVDTQPKIKPVLDLSDVKSGIGIMNGLLNTESSVGIRANVASISSDMMNRQNGSTFDVISAIDKLGEKMDNAKGDTYSINGITYSEGTELAEAIQTIVRHAKIERRV